MFSGLALFFEEAEVVVGISVGDVLHDPAEPFFVGRNPSLLCPLPEKAAQDTPEVLMAGIRQEAARVGQHAAEVGKQALLGKHFELPRYPCE